MSEYLGTADEAALKRHKRMRFLKKILRPMPRKSNIHKYPILKYFANSARKRVYLWEFRRRGVLAGIWVGWFVALVPIYSIQMLTAFIICIPARANCIVAMALQWVTNPVTIPFILYGQYALGDFLLRKSRISSVELDFGKVMSDFSELGVWQTLKGLSNIETLAHVLASVLFGGAIIALVCALISTWLYLLLANRASDSVKK
ncbi:MAG: DUF2062 domain-containing protein [Opitutales bacterium]|nr:DUF2062 domain-containing protein [Opitutales bacterium]